MEDYEPDDKFIDVLCQCGWGRLKVPTDEVPEACPLCGHVFEPDEVF